MGTLTAGIAHELRTPLSYVLANSEISQELVEELLTSDGDPEASLKELREMLVDIRSGVTRMQDLVASVRGFSSGSVEAKTPVDLARSVDTAQKLAFNELKYRARVEVELQALPMVLGIEGKLSQVVLNLMMNAAHAIEPGKIEENLVKIAGRVSKNSVFLEISDTGSGIPPENLERIFEPFFTTKPPSLGTGLGLHLCRQIISDHGGDLSVSSEPGVGTTFVIRLPAFVEEGDPAASKGEKDLELERAGPEPSSPTETGEGRRGPLEGGEAPSRRTALLVIGRASKITGEPVFEQRFSRSNSVALASIDEGMRWLKEGHEADRIFLDLERPTVDAVVFHGWLTRHFPSLSDKLVVFYSGACDERLASILELKLVRRGDAIAIRTVLEG